MSSPPNRKHNCDNPENRAAEDAKRDPAISPRPRFGALNYFKWCQAAR
jgi:hypothetical protein